MGDDGQLMLTEMVDHLFYGLIICLPLLVTSSDYNKRMWVQAIQSGTPEFLKLGSF